MGRRWSRTPKNHQFERKIAPVWSIKLEFKTNYIYQNSAPIQMQCSKRESKKQRVNNLIPIFSPIGTVCTLLTQALVTHQRNKHSSLFQVARTVGWRRYARKVRRKDRYRLSFRYSKVLLLVQGSCKTGSITKCKGRVGARGYERMD